MSTPDQWFDRMTYRRRDATGMDPDLHVATYSEVQVLTNEPCDLFNKTRRVGQQTPAGTVYSTVEEPICKIFPDNLGDLPDENDRVLVNNAEYTVLRREDFYDAGSNRYMGSRLTLRKEQGTDD